MHESERNDRADTQSPVGRERLAEEAAQVVRQAASILERELAAGIAGTAKVQGAFSETNRIDPDEFRGVVERVRTDLHELISLAVNRVSELRTDEVHDLAQRLAEDAHAVLDTGMNLVNLAPDAANRVIGRLDRAVPATDAAVPATDAAVPATDAGVPATDAAVPATDAPDSTADAASA
jgi:hypothetical protein